MASARRSPATLCPREPFGVGPVLSGGTWLDFGMRSRLGLLFHHFPRRLGGGTLRRGSRGGRRGGNLRHGELARARRRRGGGLGGGRRGGVCGLRRGGGGLLFRGEPGRRPRLGPERGPGR